MTAKEIEASVLKAGLEALSSESASRFQSYLELLLNWNARLNLTAIREPQEIVERHFVECIFAARRLPSGIETLLDFGSGGGFPGLPIAICHPEIHVTLGESQAKKAAFLREAVRVLDIQNASVFNGRAETLNPTFDAVSLRAVDKMQEACQMALRNVAAGGYLVIFATEETSQALISGLDRIDWASPTILPGSMQRQLLIGHYRVDVPRGTNSV
jgi:16S rRNA (guanine527-N7)-methyltransferase